MREPGRPLAAARSGSDRQGPAGYNLYTVTCPSCSRRPAKRACPALGHQICATCCATRRIVEIRCPSDCPHLEAAQRHPAAAVRRQQEADLTQLIGSMGRPLSERQLQLFFLLASVIVRHRPAPPLTLTDLDVAEAAAAMAGTLEAAARGIIAQLPGPSSVSEGLRRQLDALLVEVGRGGGARFGVEAAEVLRGIERGARHAAPGLGGDARDYLALLARVLPPTAAPAESSESVTPSGIILP